MRHRARAWLQLFHDLSVRQEGHVATQDALERAIGTHRIECDIDLLPQCPIAFGSMTWTLPPRP